MFDCPFPRVFQLKNTCCCAHNCLWTLDKASRLTKVGQMSNKEDWACQKNKKTTRQVEKTEIPKGTTFEISMVFQKKLWTHMRVSLWMWIQRHGQHKGLRLAVDCMRNNFRLKHEKLNLSKELPSQLGNFIDKHRKHVVNLKLIPWSPKHVLNLNQNLICMSNGCTSLLGLWNMVKSEN